MLGSRREALSGERTARGGSLPINGWEKERARSSREDQEVYARFVGRPCQSSDQRRRDQRYCLDQNLQPEHAIHRAWKLHGQDDRQGTIRFWSNDLNQCLAPLDECLSPWDVHEFLFNVNIHYLINQSFTATNLTSFSSLHFNLWFFYFFYSFHFFFDSSFLLLSPRALDLVLLSINPIPKWPEWSPKSRYTKILSQGRPLDTVYSRIFNSMKTIFCIDNYD